MVATLKHQIGKGTFPTAFLEFHTKDPSLLVEHLRLYSSYPARSGLLGREG